uniref:uridine monophosphate kinase n=1 Tax=Rhodoblastus sp. TaxID=1962975 RepID=UPI003F9919DB
MAVSSQKPDWKRVVVKLSGEALQGPQTHGLDEKTLDRIADDLVNAAELGVEIAVVVGGGNFFRGIQGADKGIERARADSIGMLATVMNALALEFAIEKLGRPARALSALPMPALCESYSRQAALHHLGKRRIVILAGGTGNPFFTTDTGAALRGAELSCDLIMKATQVDGVYSADPKRDPAA